MKKKLIYTMLLTVFVITSNAQNLNLQLGTHLSTHYESYNGEKHNDFIDNGIVNFHLGLLFEKEVISNVNFETGLIFNRKGSKDEVEIYGKKYPIKIRLNYLNAPLYAKYTVAINDKSGFYVKGGPYLGYCIVGNAIADNVDTESGKALGNIEWGNGEDQIKPYDYGASIGFGIKANRTAFQISYDWGLNNLVNVDKAYSANRTFMLSLIISNK